MFKLARSAFPSNKKKIAPQFGTVLLLVLRNNQPLKEISRMLAGNQQRNEDTRKKDPEGEIATVSNGGGGGGLVRSVR